jgi:hypothetical protein
MACPRHDGRVSGKAWGCVLMGVLAAWAGGAARAADRETRDFTVRVDDKPAGDVHMTIHHQDDGSTQVSCDTDVFVKVLLIKYRYTYRGREIWKDGRLQRFASTCDDNGKRFEVTAVAEEAGLRVRVNGRERLAPSHTWLTSYWTLPDAKVREGVVPLLDADNGRELECRIQHVGTVQMPVLGQMQNVNHYRLTGKVQVDLWYDGAERLVRQEWMEDGHRTQLDLVRIRR